MFVSLLCIAADTSQADSIVEFTKPVPDVNKPFELKWEWTNEDKTEWRWWFDKTSAEYKKQQVTCGTAGLANKLWAAGYKYGPKTWVKNRGEITGFKEVGSAQELYQALLDWIGTAKNSNRYAAIGLIGQDSYGKRYVDSLKQWDPKQVRLYNNFTWKQTPEGMTATDLSQAETLFRQCQFLELGVGHVVSVAGFRTTTDEEGKVVKREIMLHDSDFDAVDDSTADPEQNPPTRSADEWYKLVIEDGKWKIDFGDSGGGVKQVVSYKTFCPDSTKTGKSVGSGDNPVVTYDPGNKTLSFADGSVNILDALGGLSGGVDAAYAGDPLLGAVISITDLTLTEPQDEDPTIDFVYFPEDVEYGYAGYVFTGGDLTIALDGQTLLQATFPFFRILPDRTHGLADSFGIITDIQVNNSIGSAMLDDLATQLAEEGTVMDLYVEVPGYDNLADAFGGFDGDQPMYHDATYVLAKNGRIPAPSALVGLISMGITGLVIAWRRRKRQQPHHHPERPSPIGCRRWGFLVGS